MENRQTFEDADEDDSKTQKQLAGQLSVGQQAVSDQPQEMGKIHKTDRWEPYELNDRQMEHVWHFACSYKGKSFSHRTVTGDEKWIYFENTKPKKSWVDPGAPSTSTARPNHFDRKTILCV